MKKAHLLFYLLLLECYPIYGQYGYLEEGVGGGTHFSAKVGFGGVIKKVNNFSLSMYYLSRRSNNAPADYHPGLVFFGDGRPQTITELICPMYGKVFYMANSNSRFVVKGGLAIGSVINPVNFVPAHSTSWLYLGPNYIYSTNTDITAGIVLNPSIELPVCRVFGLSFGMYCVFTSKSSSIGLEGNILLGVVRNKKRNL